MLIGKSYFRGILQHLYLLRANEKTLYNKYKCKVDRVHPILFYSSLGPQIFNSPYLKHTNGWNYTFDKVFEHIYNI